MKKTEKPKHFLVLKIIGIALVMAGIILLILALTSKPVDMLDNGWFASQSSKMGKIFGGAVCLMIGIVVIFAGFTPEIHKMGVKTTKYIQEDNKEGLTDIADTSADIKSGAITKTTRAIKKGFTSTEEDDNVKIYCKHCGNKIDADSKFCSNCGGEQ